MKAYHILSIAAFCMLFLSCKKDDARPLNATTGGFSYEVLNDCALSSGSNGTRFDFQIELASAPTIPFDGIEFDVVWADGDVSNDRYDDDFIITGSTVEFDWCFRFGSLDWFEVKPTILDADGKALSNEITIRVDKPAGAN